MPLRHKGTKPVCRQAGFTKVDLLLRSSQPCLPSAALRIYTFAALTAVRQALREMDLSAHTCLCYPIYNPAYRQAGVRLKSKIPTYIVLLYSCPLSLYMPTSSPLINPRDITLGNAITIIDARSGPDAFERYQANHLAGALHADLDKDLSVKPKDPAYGGRHPLPDAKDFAAYVGKLGINANNFCHRVR